MKESLYEFVKPADGVDSLTFCAGALQRHGAGAGRPLAPLERGAKLEVTNLSWLYGRKFCAGRPPSETDAGALRPAGLWDGWPEIEPCGADGSPAYDEEQARTCIVDSYTDHATGNVVYTMDFYHDEPLLFPRCSSAIQKLADIALDEANAVTVPLA